MSYLKSIVVGSLIAVAATPALAGSYAAGCTSEPQAKWLKIEDAQAKASSLGYAISKTKVSGSCYEVYATKDARKFELFFNPVTAELVHTRAK